jgi:hypothetical protein
VKSLLEQLEYIKLFLEGWARPWGWRGRDPESEEIHHILPRDVKNKGPRPKPKQHPIIALGATKKPKKPKPPENPDDPEYTVS